MMQNVQGIVVKALDTIENMRSLAPMSEGQREGMSVGQIDIRNISFAYLKDNPVIKA